MAILNGKTASSFYYNGPLTILNLQPNGFGIRVKTGFFSLYFQLNKGFLRAYTYLRRDNVYAIEGLVTLVLH